MPKKKATRKKSTTVERKTRPTERIPVGGHRDRLTVQGKDEKYVYRWVEDDTESGPRVFRFIQGGWTFTNPEDVVVGQQEVYTTSDVGSIVRKPSGHKFVYLMQIDRDLYEADQADKSRFVDEQEQDMFRERDSEKDDGAYGGGKLIRSL